VDESIIIFIFLADIKWEGIFMKIEGKNTHAIWELSDAWL